MLANRMLDHAYDAVGNRILETTDGFPIASTYDANDRLLIQGAVTYSYAFDGNTIQKTGPSGTTDYTYDELNRLRTITGPGTTSSYAYDHDGQRTQSIENGTTTRYLVNGNRRFAQVLEERDGANTLQAHYTWGLGLIRQQRGASTSYYHHDGHGSVRALTDGAQAVTDTYDYDAYGGLQDQTGTTVNSYRYAGEQFVAGLGGYYVRARYYQPGAGRFLTRDDFAGFARNPVSLNKYLYANANPVMGVDSSGRFAVRISDVAVAGAIIATLAATTLPNFQELTAGLPTTAISLPEPELNFDPSLYPMLFPSGVATLIVIGEGLVNDAERARDRSRRRSNGQFVVRVQAQGGGTEKSVTVTSKSTITVADGRAALALLETSVVSAGQRRRRFLGFQLAVGFINRAGAGGGYPAVTKRSFPFRAPLHVDVEILAGRNLGAGPRTGGAILVPKVDSDGR